MNASAENNLKFVKSLVTIDWSKISYSSNKNLLNYLLYKWLAANYFGVIFVALFIFFTIFQIFIEIDFPFTFLTIFIFFGFQFVFFYLLQQLQYNSNETKGFVSDFKRTIAYAKANFESESSVLAFCVKDVEAAVALAESKQDRVGRVNIISCFVYAFLTTITLYLFSCLSRGVFWGNRIFELPFDLSITLLYTDSIFNLTWYFIIFYVLLDYFFTNYVLSIVRFSVVFNKAKISFSLILSIIISRSSNQSNEE
jgi:hypothetical protein